jgi:hypothetical protein
MTLMGTQRGNAQINDLSIGMTSSTAVSAQGGTVTWTFTVTNQGASAVSGVQVTNVFPAGLTYLSHSTAAGTYNSGTGVWNIGSIGAGTASVTLTVITTVTGEGVLAPRTEITAMTESDGDSTPNNQSYFEDDIAYACTTVPMWYCVGKPINITATALSGFASYQWKKDGIDIPGATNSTYTITAAGDYTYTVLGGPTGACTGVLCCPIKVQYRSSAPTVDAGLSVAVCSGASTTLTATAASGTSPYTYAWSPTGTLNVSNTASVIATPLATTTYTVTATDANGCTATDVVDVTVNPRPTANAGSDVTICAQSSTTLAGSATGGTPAYSYSWTPTATLSSGTIANPVANPTVTTTYTLVVSDVNGCSSTDAMTVTVDPKPTVNAGADVSICNQSSTVLTAAGSGGTTAYNYAWSPSTGLSATNTASVTANPTVTTTYIVTLTDSKGCTATDNVLVTVQTKPTVVASADVTLCTGASTLLDVTVTGATGSISYAWNPSAGLSASNVKSPTANPTVTTTYTVTATDANGCSNTDNVVITVNPRPTANAGSDVTICAQSSTTLAGSATGGTPAYSYSWTPTATLSSGTIANPVANPTVTTTYTLVVSDVNGCSSTDAMTVTVDPKPTVNAGADVSICNQSSTVLTAAGSGGTTAYNYAWSPSTGLSATNIASVTANPTVTTTYNVTLTDSKGCTATDNVVVTVQTKPTVVASADVTLCTGASTLLDVTVTGATGSISYAWNPSAGLSAANVKSPTANPTVTTTYTVTATDGNGCSNTDNVVITVNPRPTANAGSDVTICAQSSTTLAGSATGGTPAYSYSWTPAGTLSNASIANPVANPLATTTYTLVVSDVNGCSSTDAVVVTVDPKPTVNAGADVSICNQSSTVLTATGSGGTTAYNYAWSPSTGLSATNIASVTANPTVTTTYSVTLTDSKGCTATDNVVVTVQTKPTVVASADVTLCTGASTLLDVTVTGATGSISYAWNPSAGLSASNVKSPTANPTVTTTYTVTATDGNGCSNTDVVVITVNPRPTANAGADVTICAESSTTLAGSATGGTPAYSYSWTPTATLSNGTIANPVANPTVTTTYTLVVSDVNGCSSTDAVVVTVNPKPTLDLGADVTICSGSAQTITTTPGTGTAPYTYAWAATSGTVPTGASPSVSPTVTTTYTVTATDSKGCTVVDAIVVNVNTPVTAGVGANPAALCQAGSGLSTIILSNQLTGETAGGTWSIVSGTPGTAFNAGAGTLNPNGLPVGTYTFRYTITAIAPCPGDTEDITVTINNCCPPQICLPVTTVRN